jgi:hypothetical protein
MGSLIWMQWPIDLGRFNVAGVILFIASFVTWVGIELAEHASGNSTHDNLLIDDVKKLNSLLKIIDRKQFYVLREHSIQTYMRDDEYDGLRNVMNFRQDDIFPFHNDKVQHFYEKFCEDAATFLGDLYQLYTSDGSGRMTWRSASGSWLPDDLFRDVMAKICLLNCQASNLAKSWGELITLAKQEFKGASIGIDPYES